MSKRTEKNFWNWLSAHVGNKWHAQRHEDRYSVGIPDVSYGAGKVNGWIELKAYEKWPVSGLPHFTPKQANWLTERGKAGGHCYIMVKIESTMLLFHWADSYRLMESSTGKEEMEGMAINIWYNMFNVKEFIDIITLEVHKNE